MSKSRLPISRARLIELTILGASAGLVVACGDRLADIAGELTEDAGDMLVDAGTALRDAGGEVLDDAGRMLQDGGRGLQDGSSQLAHDARAQDACNACTASGVQRTAPASEAPEQRVRFLVKTNGWAVEQKPSSGANPYWFRYADLGTGPFVLTDVIRAKSSMSFYVVPVAATCVGINALTGGYMVPAPLFPIPFAGEALGAHGLRVNVTADERLCVFDNSSYLSGPSSTPDNTPPNTAVAFGYRTYD